MSLLPFEKLPAYKPRRFLSAQIDLGEWTHIAPLFDQLETLHGDKAAWKLVDANASAVLEVPLALPFPEDINTREDFERIVSAQRTAT